MAQVYAFLLAAIVCMSSVFMSVTAMNVNFTDCGSEESKLVSLDITPCSEQPCNMKRGTTVTGTLTFIPSLDVTSAKVKAYAVQDGFNIPLPIPSDACQGYGLECPVKKGVQANFVVKQEIQQEFPPVKLSIKGEIIDPQGKMVVCFQFPIVIS